MMPETGGDIFEPTRTSQNGSSPTAQLPDSPSAEVTNRVPAGIKLPDAVANVDMAQVTAKVDQFKKWTIGTFKNSKQQLLEHMGKIDKTIDPEFEQLCDNLKDLHRRYGAVFSASRQFSQALNQLSTAEKLLGESLYQLSLKEDSIRTVCGTTSESMKKVGEHATSLDNCLRFFLSSMETLHAKTITDTLETIYSTEGARIEYDVHRHELAHLTSLSTASPTAIQDAQAKAEVYKEKYEQLKADVRVKLRLLEENRVGVMSRQLEKLQTALCAYFTGNAQLLASSVREIEALQTPQNSFLLQ